MDSNTKLNNGSKLVTGMGPMTDRVISTFIDKFSSSEVKDAIVDKIVDPMIVVVSKKARPYIYGVLAMYISIIILLIIIIFLIVKNKK